MCLRLWFTGPFVAPIICVEASSVRKMVYVKMWFTREQWIRACVHQTDDSKRWDTNEKKAEKAAQWWDSMCNLCHDLDWARVARDGETREWKIAFNLQL